LAHRPRLKDIPKFPEVGCQRIVTLLSGTEGALKLGRIVQEAGMAWTWLDVGHGTTPVDETDLLLRHTLPELSAYLDAGEAILIHCSAGIHRTGMLAYALLRWRGAMPEQALETIAALRAETREGLRTEHLSWADGVIQDAGR